MNASPKKNPNLKFLALATITGLVGVLLFLYVLISGLKTLNESMIMVQAPGSQTLTLEQTGNYTVFHEYTHIFSPNLEAGSDDDAESMLFELTDTSQKSIPVVKNTSSSSSYEWGDRSGYSISSFKIEEAGQYELTTRQEDENVRAIMYALQHNFGRKLISLVGRGFAALGIPFIFAAIFLMLGLKPLISSKT